ncbi:MAG TPA: aquaporin [Candidatus Saccharimonadales bacterium]|jgi:glycerol uptake facilitator-like aquaporin
MFGRRKVAAVVGEFLGTATLAFTVLDVSRSSIGIPYFVAIAGGLAVVLVGVSISGDVHLNPAVTLALWTARRFKTVTAVAYIAAQLLGGWAAYFLYRYFVRGTVQHVSSGYQARVLVAEAVGAFVFTLIASAVLYKKVWGYQRAVVVGGAYALGVIVASASSNGFINPAVALGSNSWGWGTYALGPVLGAIIGVNLYALLFSGESALANAKVVNGKTNGKPKK